MAGPNSWILPGNGILGGVYVGPPKPDDPNSEPETPWAKALREAIERQPPGEAERLGTVPEQIRASANAGNPLAAPTQALIDWLRQPSAPPAVNTKSDRPPQPTMLQHELAARDSGANIGKAIVNHYADYLDPWTYDEQGRRVIDTPAAYTPNKVGKLPETEKPWWWPVVGGIDLGSNFAGLGAGINASKAATVAGRAAFAASKAAAAEAGMTGKLLNAVREGRLTELAGEGIGAKTLASRSAKMYNPPAKPLRPFEADYPQGVPVDAEGRLAYDIEGRPLRARYVVGRTTPGGRDKALTRAEIDAAAEAALGSKPQEVAAGALGRDTSTIGVFNPVDKTTLVLRTLPDATRDMVAAHEVSHGIEDLAGEVKIIAGHIERTIPTKGLRRELETVYNDLNNDYLAKARERNPDADPANVYWGTGVTPKAFGYKPGLPSDRELIAEAIRAYMWDPNYLKTVAPKTAARIREFVNVNPQLSKVIQFNAVGGAVPFIQGSQRDAGDREDTP